jgi:hypothetical protein
MLDFSKLNEGQLAQVAYLFADEHFGTNAAAYAYEVDKNGDVKFRSRINQITCSTEKKRASQNPAIQVYMIEEINITDELIRSASMSMDALAAAIANRIYKNQETAK